MKRIGIFLPVDSETAHRRTGICGADIASTIIREWSSIVSSNDHRSGAFTGRPAFRRIAPRQADIFSNKFPPHC
jgi:hypothetical protein